MKKIDPAENLRTTWTYMWTTLHNKMELVSREDWNNRIRRVMGDLCEPIVDRIVWGDEKH